MNEDARTKMLMRHLIKLKKLWTPKKLMKII